MVKKAKATVEKPAEDVAITDSKPKMSKVMYIGHLPHGFYEKQLQGFFSQFGQVTRLKVSRSKKTAKAKHYAFLEFRTPEVAQIAADAMDGYMLFTQKLDCRALPLSEVHKDLFKGANRSFKAIPWKKIEAKRHNGERTESQQEQRIQRVLKRDQKRQCALEKAGIDYKYTPLASDEKAKETKPDEKPAKKSKSAKSKRI